MRKKTTNEQLHTQFRLKPVYAAVLLAVAVQTAQANPIGGTVAAGQASFATAGNTLNVTNTPGTIINWQGFSIGANEITHFAQQSASSSVLNRVISNNPSSILGTLQSNGRVFLINPNGIVFGAGAVVDVAGLVASTLNLSNADFLAGRNHFTNPSPTGGGAGVGVSNAGHITAQTGGQIYLIAPDVENTGVITAPNGEILLAAGYSVDLVSTTNPNLRVNITAPAGDATNVGQLIAQSGSLGLFGTVVRNSGTVSADSATMQGGKIVFKATQRVEAGGTISAQGAGGGTINLLADMQSGTVNVSGKLDASAPISGNGGSIETSAAHVQVADTARVTTLAPNGKSGNWLIDPADYTIAATGGDITGALLSSNLATTGVTILSNSGASGLNGDIFVNDAVSWASANSLTLNAIRNVNINAAISNSGTGNLIVRADLNGSSIGTILFGASGSVALSGGGRADLYYNPVSYTDAATKSDTSSNPYSANMGSTPYTAWMLVNDVGLEVGGTLGLQAMGTNLAGNYALGKDFTAATSLWNAGAGFAPIGNISTPFTGSFDGLGHTIDGLFINLPGTSYVGLFGFTNASTIKNVALTNVNISGYSYVGSLVGWHQGTLTNSSNVTGIVTGTMDAASLSGNSIGGLVGMNYNFSTIDNCSSGSTVSGDNYVGGLVGTSQRSTISNSSASGAVTGMQSYAGGLVGDSYITNITSGTATGNVNGVSNVGGLVGRNGYSSNITNGIASGTVTGTNDVGGLVGMNAYNIASSHATGIVTGVSNVGGLVGNNYYAQGSTFLMYSYGSVTNSYANTGTVTGTSNVGGLVGYNYIYSSVGTSNAGGAVTGNSNVGGLVGNNERGTITTAFATGSVTGNGVGSTTLGGLVGNNSGTITDSYVTSVSVTGVNNVGGLVGYNNIYFGYANSINGSYVSSGSVTGTSNYGGLVGSNTGTLTNSHYNINGVTINGANIVTLGGLYNDNTASFNGVGQYTDWLVNGNKSLSIVNYTTPYGSFGTIGVNSYTISNAQGLKDMLGFADTAGLTFTLTAPVVLPAGYNVPYLVANFDGGALTNTLSGLYINLPNDNLGLFGHIAFGSTVSNVALVDASVIGHNNVGALVGWNQGTINSSSVSTSVSGSVSVSGANSVGGLVGNNNGTISNSSVSASGTGSVNVAGATNVGGLAGENLGAITNSYVSSGAVTATVSNIGGLVGIDNGTRSNSFFKVDAVTTNGVNNVTVAGLYATQFNNWYNGGLLTPLLITSYGTSLVLQGDGSYGIGTLQGMKDMLGFADNPAYNFSLTGSIGLNILPGFNVPNLAGSFNGNNHTLSNLSINLPNNNLGLFGVTSSSSVVSNINLVNANVSGYRTVGALVGNNFGNIDNVSVTGTVSVTGVNSGVGGLVGQNNGGTFSISGALIGGAISNSYVNGGTVIGSNGDVGGLVGYNNRGNIATSHVDNTAVSGTSHVGGLIGNNQGSASYSAGAVKGNITNSYVTNGTVTSTGGALDKAIGGLVGANIRGDIIGSHVLNSTVNGGSASWVGGLVGRNEGGVNSVYKGSATGYVNVYFGTISNSYVSGGMVSSTGTDVGGLVGNNWGALIDNSSVDTVVVIGNLNVGGLVGNDSGEGSFPSIGIVSNSHALNTQVTGSSHVGGLIGYVGVTSHSHSNYDAVFNSYVDHGTVTSNATSVSASASAIGGLVGYNSYGNISSSYVTNGTVVNGGFASNVGGLVGYNIGSSSGSNRYGVISSSYVNGGTVTGSSNVGGLAGSNYGSISNSYVSGGTVSGSSSVGGLVGSNYGTISNSYASNGVVGGSSVGGLVGSNYGGPGSVSASFWNTTVAAGVSTGIGYDPSAYGGAIGMTDVDMKIMANFNSATPANGNINPGWDIANTGGAGKIWRIYEGSTTPLLTSFLKPLTITANPVSAVFTGAPYSGGLVSPVYSPPSPDLTHLLGTAYVNATNVGTYAPARYSDQQGYDISYVSGALTITPATVTLITASDAPAIDEIVDITNQRDKPKPEDEVVAADTSNSKGTDLQTLPMCRP